MDAVGIDSKGTKRSLLEKCNRARIPIKKTVPKVISHGYIGRSKGIYQFLWKRGLVKPDEKDQDEYTMDRKRMIMEISSKRQASVISFGSVGIFFHGKTLLQYHGEVLGSIIDLSPKFTPEITGDVIEFDWVMAKIWYRKQPWELK